MKLKKLELVGFKSFADRTVIEFDSGITGVVGPNGSGKSNIGDAMRWVLGEQSAKMLRGNRMEDVIFGGTQARKPVAYCEVSLTFDNEDGGLQIDYSEVTVSRRVYRSGESEYTLNKTPCRLRDIVNLFRDSGLGKEGYSIIGQGKVDEILSNRPEERRNVFHEAAGIMKFRARKEEAERHLEHNRANLQRLADIMDVMAAQLEPLQKQSENARQYLVLTEELKDLEVNRFLRTYGELQARIQSWERELQEMDETLTQREDSVTRQEEALTGMNARLDELDAQAADVQRQVVDLTASLGERESQAQLMQERMERLGQENERLLREAGADDSQAATLRQEAQTMVDALSGKAGSQEAREAQCKGLEGQLRTLDEELARREADLERQKAAVMDDLTRLTDVKSSLSRLAALRSGIEERLRTIDEQLSAGARDTQIYEDAREDIELGLQDATARHAHSTQERQNYLELREHSRQEAANLDETISRLRERIQAGRTRSQMLKTMKRDYEGYNTTVKRLLTDARRDPELQSHLEGVVAEVMSVPRPYVLAVETALGAAMQHLITPTDQDAKALIQYLRNRQYGRATFLPLSAIRGRGISAQEQCVSGMQGCCGVASDLVSADERYRQIIVNLLGRTLIAQDMDSAIALARACNHSLRIVTLQGDVIHSGGSMTGGSIRSRYTSLLGREQELEETDKLLSQLETSFQSQQSARAALQSDIESMTAKLRELADAVREDEVALAREQERMERVRQNLTRNADTRQQLEEEQERLQANLADLSAQAEAAGSQSQDIERSNTDARAQMAEAQQRINELREDRDEWTDRLNALRMSQAADERERQSVLAQSARLEAEADRLKQAAESRRTQVADNRQTLEQQQRSLQNTAGQQSEQKQRLEKARQRASSVEAQRQSLRTTLTQQERDLRVFQQKTMEMGDKRHRLDLQLSRSRNELETLQNRMWDLYELTYQGAQALGREDFDVQAADKRIDSIRRSIRAMGPVNVQAIEEYAAIRAQHDEYVVQRQDLEAAEANLMGMIGDLEESMKVQFLDNFNRLNENFGRIFNTLFGGGSARLCLEDEEDVLDSGINIEAQPPGKKLQLLSLLSGGERTLTAISLLFAMLELKPTPFCILDEIEAALDDANIDNFIAYLQDYAKRTQFVIITHRKQTMEAADILYGVTMEEKGVSKLISVKMSEMTKGA